MELEEREDSKSWLELRWLQTHGWYDTIADMECRELAARAIMQKFVDKVDSGRARSTETYAEMKQWMEDE